MQGTTVELAGSIADSAKGVRMQPVSPALGKINKHIAIANWEARYFEKQKSGFAGKSTNAYWSERAAYSTGIGRPRAAGA